MFSFRLYSIYLFTDIFSIWIFAYIFIYTRTCNPLPLWKWINVCMCVWGGGVGGYVRHRCYGYLQTAFSGVEIHDVRNLVRLCFARSPLQPFPGPMDGDRLKFLDSFFSRVSDEFVLGQNPQWIDQSLSS